MIAYATQHEEFGTYLLSDTSKGQRKRCGDEIRGRCPLSDHADQHPSFSYDTAKGIYACSCSSGVGSELWKRLGWLPTTNGNGNGNHLKTQQQPEAIHVYANTNRKLRFRNPDGSKWFRWEHKEGIIWVKGMSGDPGLYRQDRVGDAEVIHFSESETDADALASIGLPAVSTAFGAEAGIKDQQAAFFRGKLVVIWEHQDEAGRKFSAKCKEAIERVGGRCVVLTPPGAAKIKVSIKAGTTKEEIETLVSKQGPARLWPRSLKELDGLVEALGQIERIPLSFQGLNNSLGGGGAPCWFCTVGAFSGHGKTSICISETVHHAKAGRPVLYITLELSCVEIARKIKVALESEDIDLPIYVFDETANLTDLLTVIERWLETFDAGACPVVIIDFIQKVRCTGQPSREREVAIVAEELQRLARKLGFFLICAAQLNRESQNRDKPKITDLRESGVLEQVSDLILLAQKTEPDRLRVEIGKFRWGESGKEIELYADFAHCSFGELRPDQVYGGLKDQALDFLDEHGGTAKVRDLCNAVWWKKDHPRKPDIVRAGEIFGLWVVHGSEVVKTGGVSK